ncbi:hypothetical protein G7Z17_g12067 [Cylindrodendrum hubeiense]|uniref:Uncharacterized protein n=1 Tax=Cylindrodendrum hubeiense TaxID=595255 RepID=A0A9P5L5T8_9HYPO|nr:hypothetical protein G7Z17_g12067 [Cylindrodendrum hubeiense]
MTADPGPSFRRPWRFVAPAIIHSSPRPETNGPVKFLVSAALTAFLAALESLDITILVAVLGELLPKGLIVEAEKLMAEKAKNKKKKGKGSDSALMGDMPETLGTSTKTLMVVRRFIDKISTLYCLINKQRWFCELLPLAAKINSRVFCYGEWVTDLENPQHTTCERIWRNNLTRFCDQYI